MVPIPLVQDYAGKCENFFIPPIGGTQDAKVAKEVFVGFVQILEGRFRLWTEPSPDGRLMNQNQTVRS